MKNIMNNEKSSNTKKYLSFEERRMIEKMMKEWLSLRKIWWVLWRWKSTIWDEIKNYSWKKKWPRRKNTVIADKTKKILFLSPTKNWKLHDKKQIDKTVVLPAIPKEVEIFADSWYQWIQHIHNNAFIPKKNSKKNPLSEDNKFNNRLISSIRIVVENAICWMKRFKASSDIFRWKKWQDDILNLLSAWLWNFHLQG